MRRLVFSAVSIAAFSLLAIASASAQGARGLQRTYPENIGITGAPPIPPGIAALALSVVDSTYLNLTLAQRVTLDSIRRIQEATNAPRLRTLDSLRPTRRPANGPDDLSQEQREEIAARRVAIQAVLDAIHETNSIARTQVMAIFSPEQQKRAERLENDAKKRAEEEGKRLAREGMAPPQGMDRARAGRPPED